MKSLFIVLLSNRAMEYAAAILIISLIKNGAEAVKNACQTEYFDESKIANHAIPNI